jgi:serine/alanine adding enzyme
MKLLRNSEVPIEKWNFLLLKSPYSSPFQTREFFQLYNSVSNLSAEVFAVEDSGDLKSLCVVTIQKEEGIKAYFSRRAIIYGGPLFVDNDYETGEFLLHQVYLELNKKVIYIEVRNFEDYSKLKTLFINAGWISLPYMNIKLLLKDNSLNQVLGLMKYNRRREIKLSLAEGATFRDANDISEVQNLYLILKELYVNKVKLPLPDFDYFLALFRSKLGKVFVILHNNRIIGGTFCFYLEHKSIYTMYYCGERNYHTKIFPAHLSILAAIDFGIRNKLEFIDFMGAGLKNKEYGVRKYKHEFGGELLEYGRFRKINNTFLFVIGELGLRILKLLKK